MFCVIERICCAVKSELPEKSSSIAYPPILYNGTGTRKINTISLPVRGVTSILYAFLNPDLVSIRSVRPIELSPGKARRSVTSGGGCAAHQPRYNTSALRHRHEKPERKIDKASLGSDTGLARRICDLSRSRHRGCARKDETISQRAKQ